MYCNCLGKNYHVDLSTGESLVCQTVGVSVKPVISVSVITCENDEFLCKINGVNVTIKYDGENKQFMPSDFHMGPIITLIRMHPLYRDMFEDIHKDESDDDFDIPINRRSHMVLDSDDYCDIPVNRRSRMVLDSDDDCDIPVNRPLMYNRIRHIPLRFHNYTPIVIDTSIIPKIEDYPDNVDYSKVVVDYSAEVIVDAHSNVTD